MRVTQKILNHKKYIFGICVLGVFLTILIYNGLTPYLSDDIAYKSQVREAHGLWDLLKQQYQEYLSNSGRIIGQFNIRLSLVGSKWIFNIVNSVMFVLLSLLIYWNIEGKKRQDVLLYCLIVLVIWRYSVNFGETMLWICGACNYLWGSVIILGFVTLYRKLLKQKALRHEGLTAAGMLLYGIIAGWCNENTSGGGVLLILMFTLCAYFNEKKENSVKIKDFLKPYMITSHLGMAFGLMGIVLSPGVSSRAKMMGSNENYRGFVGYLSRLYKSFVEIHHLFFELLVILGIVIIICVVCKQKGQAVLEKVLPFGIAFVATAFVLILAPTPMNRAYFGAGIFLIIACVQGFFFAFAETGEKREWKAVYYGVVWVLVLNFAFVYMENLVNLARIYREDKERIEIIEEAVKEGQESVVVPKYREAFRNPFSIAHDSDMMEDSGYWINYFYEVYFKVRSISAIPRDEWNEQYGNQ